MLSIRPDQLAEFEHRAMRRFEERVLAHLREHFPKEMEALDPEAAQSLVRDALHRARHYGLESESELASFADLSVALGPGFDTDPRYPWAAEILNDDWTPVPATRLERLYERALAYLNEAEERAAGGGA
jgi:hypothetical protein